MPRRINDNWLDNFEQADEQQATTTTTTASASSSHSNSIGNSQYRGGRGGRGGNGNGRGRDHAPTRQQVSHASYILRCQRRAREQQQQQAQPQLQPQIQTLQIQTLQTQTTEQVLAETQAYILHLHNEIQTLAQRQRDTEKRLEDLAALVKAQAQVQLSSEEL